MNDGRSISEKPKKTLEEALYETNVIKNDELHEIIKRVFQEDRDTICNTLGPGAGNTMITKLDANAPITPSKDGWNVISEIKFNEQTAHFIAQSILNISQRMNRKVGDGTTSGIPIGFDLYMYGYSYKLTESHPSIGCELPILAKTIILETIKDVVTEAIEDTSNGVLLRNIDRELENDLIRRVAMISANNNSEIGDRIANLYIERNGPLFLVPEEGTKDYTEVEKDVGFEFGSGFIMPSMANQPDRITCKLENPMYLLVDGPITNNDVDSLNSIIDYVFVEYRRPLIIIAKDFTNLPTGMLQKRTTRWNTKDPRTGESMVHNPEPVIALRINTESELSRDRLEDLRIILGGEIIDTKDGKLVGIKNNKPFFDEVLGKSLSYEGNQLSARVRGGAGDKASIGPRIKMLKERIDNLESNPGSLSFSTIAQLKKRMAMINSDMTIIKVGGKSEHERELNKLIYDDVVKACQSAVDYGFTIGGNISVPYIIDRSGIDVIEEVTKRIIDGNRHIVYRNKPEDIRVIVKDFCGMVSKAFKAAYTQVIINMVGNTPAANDIYKRVYESDKFEVYNLVTGQMNDLVDNKGVIVPGNTDTELLTSVFTVVGLLLSYNQALTIYPGKTLVYKSMNGAQ